MTDSTPWVALERADGTWDVVDNATSTAYRVDSSLGARLWQQDELWPLPLHQVLGTVTGPAASAGTPEEMPFVDLSLAGRVVRYRTADAAALHGLRSGLRAALPQRRRTADVLVQLGPEARTDLLHRSTAFSVPPAAYRVT
ncbi:hypothetical protein ACWDYJ_28830 [Streptomyces sp. NPDC003042]